MFLIATGDEDNDWPISQFIDFPIELVAYSLHITHHLLLYFTRYDSRDTRHVFRVVCEKKYNYFQKKEGFFKWMSYKKNSFLFLSKYGIICKIIFNQNLHN